MVSLYSAACVDPELLQVVMLRLLSTKEDLLVARLGRAMTCFEVREGYSILSVQILAGYANG